jgi:hypothetical protein
MITASPGGVMVLIALLLPVMLAVILSGVEAFENCSFPQHMEPPQTDAGEPLKPL